MVAVIGSAVLKMTGSAAAIELLKQEEKDRLILRMREIVGKTFPSEEEIKELSIVICDFNKKANAFPSKSVEHIARLVERGYLISQRPLDEMCTHTSLYPESSYLESLDEKKIVYAESSHYRETEAKRKISTKLPRFLRENITLIEQLKLTRLERRGWQNEVLPSENYMQWNIATLAQCKLSPELPMPSSRGREGSYLRGDEDERLCLLNPGSRYLSYDGR